MEAQSASLNDDPRLPSNAEDSQAEDFEALTPEQVAEAKEYGRRSFRLALDDMALDFAFLLIFALVAARSLDE